MCFFQVAFEVVPEQKVLVELISAIRVMPIDTLVQTLHQLVKSPPSVHGTNHVSILVYFECSFLSAGIVLY